MIELGSASSWSWPLLNLCNLDSRHRIACRGPGLCFRSSCLRKLGDELIGFLAVPGFYHAGADALSTLFVTRLTRPGQSSRCSLTPSVIAALVLAVRSTKYGPVRGTALVKRLPSSDAYNSRVVGSTVAQTSKDNATPSGKSQELDPSEAEGGTGEGFAAG